MHTKPALKVLVLYVLGLLVGRYGDFPVPLILIFTLFALIFIFILWYADKGHQLLKEVCLAVCLIMSGVVQYELFTGYFPINHISNFTNQNQPIAIAGVIVKYPEQQVDKINLTVSVAEIFIPPKVLSVRGKILVSVRERAHRFQYGDEILVRGTLRKPKDRRNPGEFDYRAFLLAQNIFGIISVNKSSQIQRISSGHGNWILRQVIFPIKYYLDNFIENNLPPQEAALLQGLLIGNRGEITIELREAFSKLGVIHILAVSGLHVGFIIIIFMGVLGFMRIPYRFLVLLTLIGLIFYAYLTNLKPPVVRASIMGGLILSGTLLERKTDIFNTLALAALIILIFNPLELLQSGFQLSFAAVISIIYLYPKLKTLLNKLKKIQKIPVVRYAFELLLVSTAAFLGTLPFTIIYFNRLPNFAPLANLLIIPLVFCGLASGIVASAFNVIMPILAKFYVAATWFFLHTVIKFVEWASQLPLAYWETYKFSLLQALAYGIGLFLIIHIHHKGARRWLVLYVLALANIFVWQASVQATNIMQVIFFDVGQGDAALLTLPHSRHILIDAGPRGENFDAGKWVIAPYLKREGIRKIDALILSHADTDHLGGVPYILQNFIVHEVWDNGQVGNTKLSQEYLGLIKSLKITRRILRAGEIIEDFKPVNLCVFHPTESFLMRKNLSLNDGSLSLKMSYGETDFLFNGDIERAGEQQISKFGHLQASEVLKISHHGSNTSTSSILLENVRPQLAIISVGAFNKFGHPDQKVLNRLHAVGTKVFRTDRDAAVILKTNGQEIKQVNWK